MLCQVLGMLASKPGVVLELWQYMWLLWLLRSGNLCIASHLAMHWWSLGLFSNWPYLCPVAWQISKCTLSLTICWFALDVAWENPVCQQSFHILESTHKKLEAYQKSIMQKFAAMIIKFHQVEFPKSWVIWSVSKWKQVGQRRGHICFSRGSQSLIYSPSGNLSRKAVGGQPHLGCM